MHEAVQIGAQWSALLLLGTTCIVLIYLVLLVANWINTLIFKETTKTKFNHKIFWIAVGAAYALAILFSFWAVLMVMALPIVVWKIVQIVKLKKA